MKAQVTEINSELLRQIKIATAALEVRGAKLPNEMLEIIAEAEQRQNAERITEIITTPELFAVCRLIDEFGRCK